MRVEIVEYLVSEFVRMIVVVMVFVCVVEWN